MSMWSWVAECCVFNLSIICVSFSVPHYNIEENSLPTPVSDAGTSSPVVQLTDTEDQPTTSESSPAITPLTTPINKCGSVGFSLGTPIEADDPDADTPYTTVKSLPDRSQFAVGVSDHILFENLPNATGTYQRLRKVIHSLHSSSSSSATR